MHIDTYINILDKKHLHAYKWACLQAQLAQLARYSLDKNFFLC